MRGSRVRVPSSAPRRNGLRSIPIFLYRKISQPLRHSSLFAKRHARLTCSLVNALTTAHSRYHLFASPRGFVRTALHSDFSLQKNQSAAPSFLLIRKKARSAHLFACKRAHDGSQSLPPFCESAWVCPDCAPFRFFFTEKSVSRSVIPPLSQKVTFTSAIRLQSHS